MAQLNKPQYKIVVDNTIHIFKKVEKANQFIRDHYISNGLKPKKTFVDNNTLLFNLKDNNATELRYEKIHFEFELTTLN